MAIQVTVTPGGKPVTFPIPVAPVVVWLIGIIGESTHIVGLDVAAVTVLLGITVIIPKADPQPPFKPI